MHIVALICARGGSKGLINKNIRLFDGIPLIQRAVIQAKSVEGVSRVIVSTDSLEIAELAKSAGAEVPFIRPSELAQDSSPEWLAWRHAIEYMNTHGAVIDVLLILPVTAPLRILKDINKCIEHYLVGDSDAVITVTDPHRNPYFNMVKVNADGRLGIVIESAEGFFRRQDAPVVYDVTTVAYVVNPRLVIEKDGIFDGRVEYVHVPKERSIDIDTIFDFEIAEFLNKKNQSA